MHDEQRITIEKVVERVTACDTAEEVKAYAKTLPEGERWKIFCVPIGKCRFLRNPDGSFKEFDGVHGESTVSIPYSDNMGLASKKDAVEAYTELFHIISSEWVKAKEAGKVPHFHMGEGHVDREPYLIMALDIARRLGITQIGIENELEDADFSGARRPGLYHWGEIADEKGRIPNTYSGDSGTISPDGWVQNRQSYIPHAIDRFGKEQVFPTDKYPEEGATLEDFWDGREKHMLQKIGEHSDGKSPVMHLCGAGHLYGLQKYTKENQEYSHIHPVLISTEQRANLMPPAEEIFEDPYIKKRAATADYRPLLHGQVKDIEHARELADSADKAVGAKLAAAFFKEHPEMKSEAVKIAEKQEDNKKTIFKIAAGVVGAAIGGWGLIHFLRKGNESLQQTKRHARG